MVTCSRCGQENPAEARFCNACAAPLAPAAETLEERKVVTVLFADLVGFTSRAEQMDPEEVRSLLRPYHARLRDELERFGGTVEKFIGDAVMAVFGAPIAHEDDAERAVRAALAIRDWILDEQAELQLRIGVNTGQALVSLGARPEEGEGMVAGDVVNTAARLQSNAPVNGILVGETTWRATRDAIDYRPTEPVQAKGKAEPVEAWEAVEARARVGVDISGRVRTPLVGRRRELDTLLDAFERAQERPPGPARDARRRAGNRQEPPRLRALSDGRARPRAHLLAPGPVAALRRGHQLLGAGRDGQGARRHPRDGHEGRGRAEAPGDGRGDRAGRRRRMDPQPSPPAGGGRGRAAAGARARKRRSPRGVASSRGSPTRARSSSSSRTSTGPTKASSTSSTTSSTGRRACRCSSSARPARSCSRAAPPGEAARRTR